MDAKSSNRNRKNAKFNEASDVIYSIFTIIIERQERHDDPIRNWIREKTTFC